MSVAPVSVPAPVEPVSLTSVRTRMAMTTKKYSMRVEGHRGAGHLEPENSIKAFKRAIELGIEGVEFDVWLTKDDVPVVVHGLPGGFVEFQGDIKEKIGNIELKDLNNYTLHNGEKIPTLAEVFDTCRDKVCLNIEVKETKEEVMGKIVDLLAERNMFDQVYFSSFNHGHRETLTREVKSRNIVTGVSFGFLMSITNIQFPNYDSGVQSGDALNLDIRYLEKNREECLAHIKRAQALRMQVNFWFPMEYADEHMFYDDLENLGINTVITNRPIEMTQFFVKRQVVVA